MIIVLTANKRINALNELISIFFNINLSLLFNFCKDNLSLQKLNFKTMIQRIQSLFLFFVFGIGISGIFLPLADFSDSKIILSCMGLISNNPKAVVSTIPLLIEVIVITLLSIGTIFLFKNRPLQIKLVRFNILLNVVYIVTIFWSVDTIEKQTTFQPNYLVGAIIPIVAMVLLFLANRAINKDEKLVKSADRLR
jgi:hypothetical protein